MTDKRKDEDVPVDTINIKREVLQGVRDVMFQMWRGLPVGLYIGGYHETLASLDAVLSEGE